jgi:hypothetical protein
MIIQFAIIPCNEVKLDFNDVLSKMYNQPAEDIGFLKTDLNIQIEERIKDTVIFESTDINDPNDMIPFAIKHLSDNPDEKQFDTYTCLETPTRIYQFIHYAENDESKINSIVDGIVTDSSKIRSPIFIISYDISNNIVDTTINDIVKMIRRRLIHTGIYLDVNENAKKYYYRNAHDITAKLWNVEPVVTGFSLCKFNLDVIYLPQKNNQEPINKIATRMIGDKYIRGDIFMIHNTGSIHGNLSMKTMKRLNVAGYGRLIDRNSDKKGTYTKYMMLADKIEEWKNHKKDHCEYCNKVMKKVYYCSKCYRTRTCGKECYDSMYHTDHCIVLGKVYS